VLGSIESQADQLPWAAERPWRTSSHLWAESGIPTIDLHDLGPALAKKVVSLLAEEGEGLQTGAACLITGQGRHSVGRAVLPQVVGDALDHVAHEHGWRVRAGRTGRILLVTNELVAPRVATGGLGPVFWIMTSLFAAAAVWACPPAGIGLAVAAIVWLIGWRNRAD